MTWTPEEATQELLQILPLLNRVVGAEVRAVAGEDTTMAQYRVLAQLAEEPRTLSVLAKWRRVSVQSMSGLVQALVERGWVERMPDPRDRRQQLLQLTGRGRAHYQQAQTQVMQRLIPLLAALSSAELDAVAQALAALGRAFAPDKVDAAAGLEGPAE